MSQVPNQSFDTFMKKMEEKKPSSSFDEWMKRGEVEDQPSGSIVNLEDPNSPEALERASRAKLNIAKLGGPNQEELKNALSSLGEGTSPFRAGMVSGGTRLIGGISRTVSQVTGSDYFRELSDNYNRTNEIYAPRATGIGGLTGELVSGIAPAVPAMVLGAVSAPLVGAATVASIGVAGVAGYGSSLNDQEKFEMDNDIIIPEGVKQATAIGVGAVEGAMNLIGIKTLTSPITGKASLAIGKALIEGNVKKAGVQIAKELGVGAAESAASMAAAQIVLNGIKKIGYDDNKTWGDVFTEGVAEQAALGGILHTIGGVVGVAKKGIGTEQNFRRYQSELVKRGIVSPAEIAVIGNNPELLVNVVKSKEKGNVVTLTSTPDGVKMKETPDVVSPQIKKALGFNEALIDQVRIRIKDGKSPGILIPAETGPVRAEEVSQVNASLDKLNNSLKIKLSEFDKSGLPLTRRAVLRGDIEFIKAQLAEKANTPEGRMILEQAKGLVESVTRPSSRARSLDPASKSQMVSNRDKILTPYKIRPEDQVKIIVDEAKVGGYLERPETYTDDLRLRDLIARTQRVFAENFSVLNDGTKLNASEAYQVGRLVEQRFVNQMDRLLKKDDNSINGAKENILRQVKKSIKSDEAPGVIKQLDAALKKITDITVNITQRETLARLKEILGSKTQKSKSQKQALDLISEVQKKVSSSSDYRPWSKRVQNAIKEIEPLLERATEKVRVGDAVRNKVRDLVKELPDDMRATLLSRVIKAKTPGELNKVVKQVEEYQSKYNKQVQVNRVKELVKKFDKSTRRDEAIQVLKDRVSKLESSTSEKSTATLAVLNKKGQTLIGDESVKDHAALAKLSGVENVDSRNSGYANGEGKNFVSNEDLAPFIAEARKVLGKDAAYKDVVQWAYEKKLNGEVQAGSSPSIPSDTKDNLNIVYTKHSPESFSNISPNHAEFEKGTITPLVEAGYLSKLDAVILRELFKDSTLSWITKENQKLNVVIKDSFEGLPIGGTPTYRKLLTKIKSIGYYDSRSHQIGLLKSSSEHSLFVLLHEIGHAMDYSKDFNVNPQVQKAYKEFTELVKSGLVADYLVKTFPRNASHRKIWIESEKEAFADLVVAVTMGRRLPEGRLAEVVIHLIGYIRTMIDKMRGVRGVDKSIGDRLKEIVDVIGKWEDRLPVKHHYKTSQEIPESILGVLDNTYTLVNSKGKIEYAKYDKQTGMLDNDLDQINSIFDKYGKLIWERKFESIREKFTNQNPEEFAKSVDKFNREVGKNLDVQAGVKPETDKPNSTPEPIIKLSAETGKESVNISSLDKMMKNWDLDQVESFADDLQKVIRKGEIERGLYDSLENFLTKDSIERATKEISSFSDMGSLRTLLEVPVSFVKTGADPINVHNFLLLLAKGNENATLYHQLVGRHRSAFNTVQAQRAEGRKFLAEKAKQILGFDTTKALGEGRYTFYLTERLKNGIQRSEAMWAYALHTDPGRTKAVEEFGIEVDSKSYDLKETLSLLSEKDKKFVDETKKYLFNNPWIEKAFDEFAILNGFEIHKDLTGKHFVSKRVVEEKQVIQDENQFAGVFARKMDYLKERVEGARGAFKLDGGYISAFNDYVDTTSRYGEMGRGLLQSERLLLDTNFKKSFIAKFGAARHEELVSYLKNLHGFLGRDPSFWDKAVTHLTTFQVLSRIQGNVASWMRQHLSFITMMSEGSLDKTALAQAALEGSYFNKRLKDDLMDNSGTAYLRLSNSGFTEQIVLQGRGKISPKLAFLQNQSLFLQRSADSRMLRVYWRAAEIMAKRQGLTGREAKEFIIDKFETSLQKSQSTDSPIYASKLELLAKDNPLLRGTLSFKRELNRIYNLGRYDVTRAIQEPTPENLSKAGNTLFWSFLVNPIMDVGIASMRLAAYGLPTYTLGEYAVQSLKSLVGNWYLAGDVASLFSGQSQESLTFMSSIKEGVEAIEILGQTELEEYQRDEEKDESGEIKSGKYRGENKELVGLERAGSKAISSAAGLLGLPFWSVYTQGKGLYNWQRDDLRLMVHLEKEKALLEKDPEDNAIRLKEIDRLKQKVNKVHQLRERGLLDKEDARESIMTLLRDDADLK